MPGHGVLEAERRIEHALASGATELDLSDLGLNTVPEAITRLTQLQSLNLGRNQLTTVPEAITRLTQLQSLNLGRNQLTTVPEAITRLTQLQSLYLGGIQLTTVPEAITRLTQLQTLNLGGNQLTTVPEAITRLTQLQVLDLWGNQLTTVPEAITRLTQLQTLNLGHTQLTTVPEAIARLTQLQTLDLGWNQLTTMPEAIARLTQLQSLYLLGNRLTTVPEAITRLTQLQSLDLGGNQLTTVPEAITRLTQLQSLYLGGNRLTTVPEAITRLTQLQDLYLGGAGLKFPDLPSELQRRHIHGALRIWIEGAPQSAKAARATRKPRATFGSEQSVDRSKRGWLFGLALGMAATSLADASPTPAPPAKPKPKPAHDTVEFGVSHPDAVAGLDPFVVRALAFRQEDRAAAQDYAAREFGDAHRLPLGGGAKIRRGAKLAYHLSVDGCRVDPPEQIVAWTGAIATASFRVTPDRTRPAARLVGVCEVRTRRAILCEIHFEIPVGATQQAQPVLATATAPKSVFISYASLDFPRVWYCARGMKALAVEVHMDRLVFRPGQRWQAEIFRHIDIAEKLYLFWSRHAARSAWVEREWRYGLATKGIDFIQPFPLTDPRRVPPPPELGAVLHFNDPDRAHDPGVLAALWSGIREVFS